jgi:multisubunit Na+/H+ antiporter MnhE subunit
LTSSHRGGRAARTLRRLAPHGWFWIVTLAFLFGAWELFVDTYTWPEILAGLGAAAIAATTLVLVKLEAHEAHALRPAWLRAGARLPVRLMVDWWRIATYLAVRPPRGRPVTGRMHAVRFDVGGDDALSGGRRALQDYYTTFTCNTLSLGVDRDGGWILVHELAPTRPGGERVTLPVRL